LCDDDDTFRSQPVLKKQNKQWIKAHLLRGGFYLFVGLAGALVFFFRVDAQVSVSDRTLTFANA
jgi:hypothetical protein